MDEEELQEIEKMMKSLRDEAEMRGGDAYWMYGSFAPDVRRLIHALREAKATQPEDTTARDAARYRWLRDLNPNQLHLSRNDHASNYCTAAQEIADAPENYSNEPPEAVQAMKDADTIWTLQVYPDTPVGFVWLHRATLDALLDAAMADDDSFRPQREPE